MPLLVLVLPLPWTTFWLFLIKILFSKLCCLKSGSIEWMSNFGHEVKKFDWDEKGFKCSEMDFNLIFPDNKCLLFTRLGDLNSLYKALSLNYFEVNIVNQELRWRSLCKLTCFSSSNSQEVRTHSSMFHILRLAILVRRIQKVENYQHKVQSTVKTKSQKQNCFNLIFHQERWAFNLRWTLDSIAVSLFITCFHVFFLMFLSFLCFNVFFFKSFMFLLCFYLLAMSCTTRPWPCSGVVNISRLALRLRRSARREKNNLVTNRQTINFYY